MRLIITIFIFLMSVNIYAGILLESLTQEDLDSVHKDVASLMLTSFVSSGAPINEGPGVEGLGIEIGVVGGLGSLENMTDDEVTSMPVMFTGYIIGGISIPGSVTFEGYWRPRIYGTAYYGGGVRWTFTNLFDVKPLNIDIGSNYGRGTIEWGQTSNSQAVSIDIERNVFCGGSTIGAEFSWFRPYVYLGYAKSYLDIKTNNGISVFDPSLSGKDSAKSEVASFVGRAGLELKFQSGNMGIEYQQAFGDHRVVVKTSGRFP